MALARKELGTDVEQWFGPASAGAIKYDLLSEKLCIRTGNMSVNMVHGDDTVTIRPLLGVMIDH